MEQQEEPKETGVCDKECLVDASVCNKCIKRGQCTVRVFDDEIIAK